MFCMANWDCMVSVTCSTTIRTRSHANCTKSLSSSHQMSPVRDNSTPRLGEAGTGTVI